MKNEDLYVYKKSDFYEDYISSQKEYYEREQVDTLLAEKDQEIALLKKRICNGDVSRATWIDDCIAKDKEIAELKQRIDKLVGVKKSAEKILQNLLDCGYIKEWYFNGKFIAVLSADDPHLQIADLKKKLESVQASLNCDVVDANMEVRRLKRALWLMTAEWAEGMGLASCNIAIKLSFKERFFYHDEDNREKDIKKYKHRQVIFYKYADYCKKKAEEY